MIFSAIRIRPSASAGYSFFIQRKPDDYASVFSDKRKYAVHRLLLPADRINHCLSVIYAQRPLHCLNIHCVDLERQIDHALNLLHRFFHKRRFIDIRKSNIYIQDMRPVILLCDCFSQDIIQVVLFERLFKTFLTRRIDPFSDNLRPVSFLCPVSEKYALSVGRYDSIFFLGCRSG